PHPRPAPQRRPRRPVLRRTEPHRPRRQHLPPHEPPLRGTPPPQKSQTPGPLRSLEIRPRHRVLQGRAYGRGSPRRLHCQRPKALEKIERRGAVVIRAHFGLAKNPFCSDSLVLLAHQQQVLDTLRVHCQQGGLCVIVGEPGTGKSVIKQALCEHDPKRIITPVVNRTLHTYHSTLRILCEAFQLESDGADFRCEKRLVEEARRLNSAGKMLAPIIDDAHLMEVSALRKIRLLFEDFPKNHCLVLVAQPELLSRLSLTVNEDIKNRVT